MNKNNLITKTIQGLDNEINQDYFKTDLENKIFILADGMGGIPHKKGEIASMIAVTELHELIKQNKFLLDSKKIQEEKAPYWLKRALEKTNEAIVDLGKTDTYKFTGTTIEAIQIHNNTLFYGHVGDSLTFLIRPYDSYGPCKGSIQKLGHEDSENSNNKNSPLLKYIGQPNLIIEEKDIKIESIYKGDIIFSCSDGITKIMNQDDIFELIMNHDFENLETEILKRKEHSYLIKDRIREEHNIEEKILKSNESSIYTQNQTTKTGPKKNPTPYTDDDTTFIIYKVI